MRQLFFYAAAVKKFPRDHGRGAALLRDAAMAWARARMSVVCAFTFVREPCNSISTEPSRSTLRSTTALPGGTWMLPTFTPLRMTGNRTGAKRTICRGQSSGCRAISAMSSGAAGMTVAVGSVGDDCGEGGSACSASDGGRVEGAGVGVGADGLVSAMAGGEVGAGVASLGPVFTGIVGSETVAGAAAGEVREAVALDSQVDSGRRLDHSQSPALDDAQKIASQERGLWKNLRIRIISRLRLSNRKRNSFCSSPPDP